MDETRFRLYAVDNTEDTLLRGMLEVLSNAKSGDTDLTVRNHGQTTTVTLTIPSATTVTRSTGGSPAPEERNLMSSLADASPLYLQNFQLVLPTSLISIPTIELQKTVNLFTISRGYTLIRCPSSQGTQYGDRCLKDLAPGQPVDIRGEILSLHLQVDALLYWSINPLSYPYVCWRYNLVAEILGAGGFFEWGVGGRICVPTGDSDWLEGAGLNSIALGGGGSCIRVTPLQKEFPHEARARVIRLGCCDDEPVTMSTDGTLFKGRVDFDGNSIAEDFDFTGGNRLEVGRTEAPANCMDTTLTIDDEEDHPNILLARGGRGGEGEGQTTVTVLADDSKCTTCPTSVTRWLQTEFGNFGEGGTTCTKGQVSSGTPQTQKVTIELSDGKAEATYWAGCVGTTDPAQTTRKATIQLFRENPDTNSDATALGSVNVLHYNGFKFRDLGIDDEEMIVPAPSDDTFLATVEQDAAEIQTFFREKTSFLKDFWLNPETKEGFYDQDGSNTWTEGDILYKPWTDDNPNPALDNEEFDPCHDANDLSTCGTNKEASYFIALAASCDTDTDPCTKRVHRVMPRNMLVTLQKEQSLVAKTGYPPTTETWKLNGAMGCGVTDEDVSDPTKLNFFDQINCGADTFVRHYTQTHFNDDTDRPLEFTSPFFFKLADGFKHGGIRPQPMEDPVAFSVKNRVTYIQYRYTNWIQAEPKGGGVLLFRQVWNHDRFKKFPWRKGSP